jgi:hypothetical protein
MRLGRTQYLRGYGRDGKARLHRAFSMELSCIWKLLLPSKSPRPIAARQLHIRRASQRVSEQDSTLDQMTALEDVFKQFEPRAEDSIRVEGI